MGSAKFFDDIKHLVEIDMVDDTTGFAVGDIGILKHQVYTPVQPIDLLQPNAGGDIFQIGTKRFIIWQIQAGITNVKLEYSTTEIPAHGCRS